MRLVRGINDVVRSQAHTTHLSECAQAGKDEFGLIRHQAECLALGHIGDTELLVLLLACFFGHDGLQQKERGIFFLYFPLKKS